MKLRNDLAALLPRLRDDDLYKFCVFYEKYAPHLADIASGVYDRLSAADQSRFVLWFLKRWAKIDLVNPIERHLYDTTIERLRTEPRPVEELNGVPYRLRDMTSQGYDFKMLGYDWWLGAHDIRYGQYEQGDIQLAPGDVIIDAGAFIGDTGVYFHHKLGGRCQVHSFELLDENLALLVHNFERNGVRDGQVVINKLALADRTGDEIVIADGATQGSTSIFGKAGQGTKVQTITLDDYVMGLGLEKVDFIKMDIEGAELQALAGARQTIQHFKPKLAICLYHKWNDAFTIPQAIHATGVDYSFTFKWVQLKDGWEAILLAIPTERATHPVRPPAAPDTSATDPMADALGTFCRAYARKFGQVEALRRDKREAERAVVGEPQAA
ncbi:FkbM family methyltransferase [Ideonella sp.]|uniref:FkbM family methyltransferase n=1 Tax=Ideonella sp. TaxID=1929293 RepID=UPI0035B476B0